MEFSQIKYSPLILSLTPLFYIWLFNRIKRVRFFTGDQHEQIPLSVSMDRSIFLTTTVPDKGGRLGGTLLHSSANEGDS